MLRLAGLCCVLIACDGEPAGPDADPDDLDGDGIANVDDNCAQGANPDQHDEDRDAFGDVCDNCPTVANVAQADTTEAAVNSFADGVGDSCDYRPGLAGDQVGAFFSWSTPEQMNAWTGTGWTIASDELRTTGAARWQIKRGETGTNGLIVVAGIAAIDLSAGPLTIALDGDGINAGLTCTLQQGLGGEELVAHEIGGAMELVNVSAQNPSIPRTLVAWRRATLLANELECRIEQGSTISDTTIALTDDVFVGTYSLASPGTSASLSSLIVLTSPGPKNP